MNLNLSDKLGFINNFLKPLNNFSETGIFNLEKNKITALVSSIDNTTILYAQYLLDKEYEQRQTLNIPNIDKFINSLKVIDANEIELILNSNNIQYQSSTLKFKFHLYEDGILSSPKINIDKVNSFNYDVNFEIDGSVLGRLIKSSLITPEITKVYLYSQDNKIHAELTDRTISNSDMFSFCVVEEYSGSPITTPIPLMLSPIRALSSLNLGANISINNEYGIVQFKIMTSQSILQYIITSVVS
jgi:hypothetical protein